MTNHHDLSSLGLLRAVLQTWRDRQRQRHELAKLSERDMHDLGISWSDMMFEAEKPFWRG
ncbi:MULTISPECIES: DUF1127 domain-containing protein [Rhodopseudomonas]